MKEKQDILLGVNIDHVATLRQARGTHYPDPIHAAFEAEKGGADGITLHLREDRRHIQDRDLRVLKDTVETRINLEMAVTEEMLEIATTMQPTFVCLVPEKREELTTEGGLDVVLCFEKIKEACQRLQEANIQVSLFIDPNSQSIVAAKDAGADFVEIHTGHYADAPNEKQQLEALKQVRQACSLARAGGLKVNAGHGLNYHNVCPIAQIPEIIELNIGHAIISESVFCGLQRAVHKMKTLITQARNRAWLS